MHTRIFLVALLVCCSVCFKIKTQDQKYRTTEEPNIEKIPTYLGKSYHLIKGNPYSNKIDEGFRTTLFEFTYQKGLTTDDGKYAIPDNTHSTQSTACSLDATSYQYSGTQKYQQSLKNTISVDSKASYMFVKASFSMSATFSEFSESTISKNRTVTQSDAECSAYIVEMPIFSNNIKMTEDFVDAVIQTTESGDWDYFVSYFGSHYAYRVTFGGRYVYSHSYTAESMSYFKSKELDISIAAKVQFANYFSISMSDDLKRYQNQTNAINTKVEETKSSIIGGEPQKGGSWVDWQKTVKDKLAPVSYQLGSISNIFHFIPNLDVAKATAGFNSYLQKYCEQYKCPPLSPDRPEPKPLAISFTKTSSIHGKQQGPRPFDTNDGQIKVGMRVYKVLMGSQGCIDSVQFFLTDDIVEYALPAIGSSPFSHEYNVPKNDEIECIRFGIIWDGDFYKFVSMQFVTRKKQESEVYKGSFGVKEYRILCLESNDDHFVGYYGFNGHGDTFNSIGFNVLNEKYQP